MALAARWLEPTTIQQLRQLVINGNPHAIRALRQMDGYRHSPARSKQRRAHKRAFERHASRALGWENTNAR